MIGDASELEPNFIGNTSADRTEQQQFPQNVIICTRAPSERKDCPVVGDTSSFESAHNVVTSTCTSSEREDCVVSINFFYQKGRFVTYLHNTLFLLIFFLSMKDA